jgi:hypothetical protein
VTALSCSAPIELNTSTDNQIGKRLRRLIAPQRRPQESRIEKARPLTWIKGAAAWGIMVRYHPRWDPGNVGLLLNWGVSAFCSSSDEYFTMLLA